MRTLKLELDGIAFINQHAGGDLRVEIPTSEGQKPSIAFVTTAQLSALLGLITTMLEEK